MLGSHSYLGAPSPVRRKGVLAALDANCRLRSSIDRPGTATRAVFPEYSLRVPLWGGSRGNGESDCELSPTFVVVGFLKRKVAPIGLQDPLDDRETTPPIRGVV